MDKSFNVRYAHITAPFEAASPDVCGEAGSITELKAITRSGEEIEARNGLSDSYDDMII